MTSAAQFFQAARFQPPKVLRRQLVDFTLGHYLFLSEADSPFLPERSERHPQPLDLYLAVHICSGAIEAQKASLRKVRFWWWEWRCRKLDELAEVSKFLGYIRQSFKRPEIPTTPSSASTIPHVCGLISFLCDRMNQPYGEVLNIPLCSAVWLYAGWAEHNIPPNQDSNRVIQPWRPEHQEFYDAVAEIERREARN